MFLYFLPIYLQFNPCCEGRHHSRTLLYHASAGDSLFCSARRYSVEFALSMMSGFKRHRCWGIRPFRGVMRVLLPDYLRRITLGTGWTQLFLFLDHFFSGRRSKVLARAKPEEYSWPENWCQCYIVFVCDVKFLYICTDVVI